MAVSIPPWLQVSPQDFAAAGERGLSAGVSAAGVRSQAESSRAHVALEAQRLAQQHQAEQQQIAQAAQQFQEQQKMKSMELAAERDQQEKQFLVAQQRNQVTDAYHTAVVGIQQKKLQDASEAAAKKYAAQQKLSALVQSGVPFDQAIVQVPELMGTGVETLLTKGATTPATGKMSDIDKKTYDTAQKEMVAASKELAGISTVGGWLGHKSGPQAAIKAAQEKLDAIRQKYIPGGGAAGGATHKWNPQTGTIEPIGSGEERTPPAMENPYEDQGLPVSSGFMYTGQNAEVPAR